MPQSRVASPADGSTVCGTPLAIELEIANFVLVDPSAGSEAHPGEGHVDVYLNGQSVAMNADESFEIPIVDDGAWQLRAELVNADHTAVEPYAGDVVFFTADNTLCP